MTPAFGCSATMNFCEELLSPLVDDETPVVDVDVMLSWRCTQQI
jgi:hypothetical protein